MSFAKSVKTFNIHDSKSFYDSRKCTNVIIKLITHSNEYDHFTALWNSIEKKEISWFFFETLKLFVCVWNRYVHISCGERKKKNAILHWDSRIGRENEIEHFKMR